MKSKRINPCYNPLGIKVGDRIKFKSDNYDTDHSIQWENGTVTELHKTYFRCYVEQGGYYTCINFVTKYDNYSKYAYKKVG